ncbi:MAG: radical SAM protein [Desulfobacteraceae bacterium]|nr:radical SAM protein [Desulfobacteraceae bacterium]
MIYRGTSKKGSTRCGVCGETLKDISTRIGVCPTCVRTRPDESRIRIEKVHAESREMFGLPTRPAANPDGTECKLCFLGCRLGPSQKGYCGIRNGGRSSLRNDGRTRALLTHYYDPLPTNCVADWVCPGGTGAGFPQYAYDSGPEVGYYNLAVFFEACNFNCLYCQNWSFKKNQLSPRWTGLGTLVDAVNVNTSCICFFGGDPGPQLPFAFRLAKAAQEKRSGKILRICWETNGTMNPVWLKKMTALSLESGGCVKIDLKTWNPGTHRALCGWGNEKVLENFARVADWVSERKSPPPLVASTPLVPGYIDEDEIYGLASFIARINPDIPYALLAFAPQFLMDDSPTTSTDLARRCLEAAKRAGLTRVRLGNEHLLC